MTREVYEPGQVRNIFPYVPSGVRWFVIGGPADGDEAQVFKQEFPNVQAVGFEPNEQLLAVQREADFPGMLFPYALWHEETTRTLIIPDPGRQGDRSASLVKFRTGAGYREVEVKTTTLDLSSAAIGPFRNCVLWLDIEGAELNALVGAHNLLASGQVSVINLEVFSDHEHPIRSYLSGHGYREVHRWGEQVNRHTLRRWWNAVFILD